MQNPTKDTTQYIKNKSFDPTYQRSQIELLGYDSTAGVLRPIAVDATGQVQVVDATAGSNHAALSNLDYASAGHTGFLQDTNNIVNENHIDWGSAGNQVDTSDMPEGTNLYFTDERAQDAVGNSVGVGLSYDDGSGAISCTITQYTDEMAQDAVGNYVGNGLDYDDISGAISVDESELHHGAISGLGDDDHTIYIKADGTRAFSDEVAGITPTEDDSLATKGYVDDVAAGLAWQEPVLDKDLTSPPGSPSTGDRYIVGSGATGGWSGQDLDIAEYNGASWDFSTPTTGWAAYVTDENKAYNYNGSIWVIFSGSESNHAALSNLSYASAGHTGFLADSNDIIKDSHIDWGTGAGQIQNIQTTASPQFANLIITGAGYIRPSADSTTALKITKADGTTVFTSWDSTNKRMSVGDNLAPTGTLTLNAPNAWYGSNKPTLNFYYNTTNYWGRIYMDANWNMCIESMTSGGSTSDINLITDANSDVYINTRRVGIKNASPSNVLSVTGSTDVSGGLFVGAASTAYGAKARIVHTGNKNVLLMQSDVSSTTVPYANTGFGISQQDGTANNYALFTFYTGNWNDAAAFGCRYIDHTTSNAIGQMHILTANGGSLVTQFIIDQDGDITIGSGEAGKDYNITVNGQTYDLSLTAMEDEDYWQFDDGIMIPSTEQIYFRDTAIYIDSATDGHLDLTADISVDINANLDISAKNIITDTSTGTKIGTAADQKLGFYNAAPIVQQTTAVAEAAFVENAGGAVVNVDSTFGGYTLQQAIKALQLLGLLA